MSSGKPLSKEETARRKRAAEILGDLLPATTTDETAEGWNEHESSDRDAELRRDLPPHYGKD